MSTLGNHKTKDVWLCFASNQYFTSNIPFLNFPGLIYTKLWSTLSICMQLSISSEFTWLRPDLKIPAVGNQALPESDMCYNSLMSYLTRTKVRIDSNWFLLNFFIISLLLFVCWLSVIFLFFCYFFFQKASFLTMCCK